MEQVPRSNTYIGITMATNAELMDILPFLGMSYDLMSGSSSNPMVRIERDIMMTLEDYTERQKAMYDRTNIRLNCTMVE